jgi:hypothetical protein
MKLNISAKTQLFFGYGGTNLLGFILLSRRDENFFRHPTRQLTSSAKAKEVMDRQVQRLLCCEKTFKAA